MGYGLKSQCNGMGQENSATKWALAAEVLVYSFSPFWHRPFSLCFLTQSCDFSLFCLYMKNTKPCTRPHKQSRKKKKQKTRTLEFSTSMFYAHI